MSANEPECLRAELSRPTEHLSLVRSPYVRWVAANGLGWAVGLVIAAGLVEAAARFAGVNPDHALIPIALLSAGAATGTFQSVALRGGQSTRLVWVLATVAGFAVGLLLAAAGAGRLFGTGLPSDALLLLVLGAAVGICQWLALRRQGAAAVTLVPATSISFLVFMWLMVRPASTAVELVVVGSVLGALASVAPGFVLGRRSLLGGG